MSEDKRVIGAGEHLGECVDYGISKNSKGEPQAFLKFKINKGEGLGFCHLTWFGGLSDKIPQGKEHPPAHYTVKTLLDCGFQGQEVEDLAGGIDANVIPGGRTMQLTIEDNLYEDKLSSRIKWINIVGAGGPKKMSKEELVGKTNTSALRAMLLKEKQNRPTEAMPEPDPDIPF